MTHDRTLALDHAHVWHPYSTAFPTLPPCHVKAARGCELILEDNRTLLDGMSSWWSAIHGYNHPRLNAALHHQLENMAHVMFGGLTHEPAAMLAGTLCRLAPDRLQKVFFSDSGSVAVEVAIKMAFQYWIGRGNPKKHRLLALRGGYHGDTFAAMSVCDPITGMHHLFRQVLTPQLFTERPACRFGETCSTQHTADIENLLEQHHNELAAVILEPIVQGAGGMWFYSADFLRHVRALCDRYDVLLIADEIATGFGRTGKLFACEHAGIQPDILCLGKAMTGGYMTLAATLCNNKIVDSITHSECPSLMHGPTFMGNPLACAVANASIGLLLEQPWQLLIQQISRRLVNGLSPASSLRGVAEVRVLGAIGVVELENPVDMQVIQPMFIEEGVWIRPFGKLVYLMPPYIMQDSEVDRLCAATTKVLHRYLGK